MGDPWRGEAEELFERLKTQNLPPEFFHTLRDLIDERFPRGRGRRKGTGGVDDRARLARLARPSHRLD